MSRNKTTALGPRQHHEARKDANMIAARANGVHKYLAEGDCLTVHDDDDAVEQLTALIEDADSLRALIKRAQKRRKGQFPRREAPPV